MKFKIDEITSVIQQEISAIPDATGCDAGGEDC